MANLTTHVLTNGNLILDVNVLIFSKTLAGNPMTRQRFIVINILSSGFNQKKKLDNLLVHSVVNLEKNGSGF